MKEGEIHIMEEKKILKKRETRAGERERGRDTYNGRIREKKSWRERTRKRYV